MTPSPSPRFVTCLLVAAFAAACGNTTPSPAPPSVTVDANPAEANCAEARPDDAATCMQDCGPPVVRDGDPEPAWRWLTPDEVAARNMGGCPRCLAAGTLIATPRGAVAVDHLAVGDLVWSVDAAGARIAAPIARMGSVATPASHALVVVELSDHRVVAASAGHPLLDARAFGTLRVGDPLDGATIVALRRQPYGDQHTWDLLPATPSGAYWASGVLIGSTLR